MIKLLENKSIIKFLGIALSILLVIALVPQINTAYGSKDDVPDEGTDPTTELVGPEEEGAEGEEGEDGGESVATSPVEETTGVDDAEDTSINDSTPDQIVPVQKNAPRKLSARNGEGTFKVFSSDETIKLENGETYGFQHIIVTNGTLTIEGTGTIDAAGTTCTYDGRTIGSVIVVEGPKAKLVINGNITITGGTGTLVNADDASNTSRNVIGKNTKGHVNEGFGKQFSLASTNISDEAVIETYIGGGGILVQRTRDGVGGASLNLQGGVVTGNTARAGGGIFIDRACGFYMENATVENNNVLKPETGVQTVHEGGGIYMAGNFNPANSNDQYAYIKSGTIKTNKTETTLDWGGGGIFVENMGVLKLATAKITTNEANGLGGGVAGCPHANIGVGDPGIGKNITDTTAIYMNKSNYETSPSNKYLTILSTTSTLDSKKSVFSGDMYFYGLTKSQNWNSFNVQIGDWYKNSFKKEYGQDFYCTKISYVFGNDLGQDGDYAWTGFQGGPDGSKTVSIKKNEPYVANDASLALTNTMKKDIKETYPVEIFGNYSGTHGGGIGCNGTLLIGDLEKTSDYGAFSFVVGKSYKNDLGNDVTDPSGFSFYLYNEDPSENTAAQPIQDEETKRAREFKSDKEGKVVFKVPPSVFEANFKNSEDGATKKVTLFFKEKDTGLSGVTYDEHVYKAELNIECKLVVYKVPSLGIEKSSRTPSVHGITVSKSEGTGYAKIHEAVQDPSKQEDPSRIDVREQVKVQNTKALKAEVPVSVNKTISGFDTGNYGFTLDEVSSPDSTPDTTMPIALKPMSNGYKDQVSTEFTADSPKSNKVNFKSIEYDSIGTHWYKIAEQEVDSHEVSYDRAVYLLKVDVTESSDRSELVVQRELWKAESNDTTFKKVSEPNYETAISFVNVVMEYRGFQFELQKKLVTTLDNDLPLTSGKFEFEFKMYSDQACENPVGGVSYDKGKGVISVNVEDTKYVKEAYANPDLTKTKTFTFYLKETQGKTPFVDYLKDVAPIDVTLVTEGARNSDNTAFVVKAKQVVVNLQGGQNDNGTIASGKTVTNRYTPNGSWQFTANKYFYGIGSASTCSFSLVELQGEPKLYEPLSKTPKKDGTKITTSVSAEALDDGREQIVFDPITYQVDGEVTEGATEQPRDDRGDHYYLVTETGNAASKDTTAYVVKVTVTLDENDKGKLVATETMVGYADNINAPLNPSTARPVFYNTDTYDMVAAANYSVYAASGEPVDQVCYVDPKVIKNLEGRSIKSGEFAFKLIEVQNYNDTEGQLISATANDEFGMVDFDKANNVSGDLENPSCLVYSRPGTYYYRVIEDTSQGGMKDQSVVYSDQIITFTTVIEQDEATGQLVCTDMYYGWWDKEAGKNVRYDEQYLDYADQPSNIGDMSKLNTNWHPTITNRTRAMDLQVRKTSVTDRDEGLVGATYALYAVNDNAQGDVMLAEATSEEGGWITYKNVSLTTNNLYYFKEVAAPAGHTVSEFRSPYFYLVEDATSPNGYTLKYADKKDEAASALAAQAEIAAMATEDDEQTSATDAQAADSRAGDDQQPGHSADGNVLLTYDRDGGVYDEATQLDVNKLDTRTHEWVEGAELAIIEKDTGREVVCWTSGKASKQLEKVLNVGTAYILRELKAPENYQVAGDVEFVIDDYGAVSITKGNSNGNAELSGTTITLYDTMLDAEVVDRVERPADGDLAQTGDWLPIAGLASVGLAALIVAIIARRRRIS